MQTLVSFFKTLFVFGIIFHASLADCLAKDQSSKNNKSKGCSLYNYQVEKINTNFNIYQSSIDQQLSLSAASSNGAINPVILYNMQMQTASTLTMADYCRDYQMIDKLSKFYAKPFQYLQSDKEGNLIWKDLSNPNYEVPLYSTQFLYAVARHIRTLSELPVNKLSVADKYFLTLPKNILIAHLKRWLNKKSMWIWSSCGYSAADPRLAYTFFEYVEQKVINNLQQKEGAPVYCNAITENELWVAAAGVELLAANDKSPQLIGLASNLRDQLISFSQIATRLFESRLTIKKVKNKFCKNGCDTMLFDIGAWHGHPEYPAAIWGVKKNEAWDISHARRLVQFIDSIYKQAKFSKPGYSRNKITKIFSNTIAYLVFRGDFKNPLFNNFINGLNYPYRTYGSSELSFSYPASGFPRLGPYNNELGKLNSALEKIIRKRDTNNSLKINSLSASDEMEFYSSLAR